MLAKLKLFRAVSVSTSVAENVSKQQRSAEINAQLEALNRVQAVIRFGLDGTILDANANFLKVMGYTHDETVGRHHSMFVDRDYAQSPAYREFWQQLMRGEFVSGEFRRIAKNGEPVWLQASYNPVFDQNGQLLYVIKFATDVTREKLINLNYRGQIEAIQRVQGVIEFDLQGNILTANDNFLQLMGYGLSEILGKHHSMFVDPDEAASPAYKAFWQALREGRPDARVFKRLGKNGKLVWIQASYNPIFDADGRPFKVVKFASDLTAIIGQTQTSQSTAESVASATEELSCSIAEIGRNMELSSQATEQIMNSTEASGREASDLVESMKSMQRIIELIREIAGRVKLLALNATIEAARAGEAGKGFAVVAQEVRTLSDQTAKATHEIGEEIASVHAISNRVADRVQSTVSGVTQVSQYVNSVAAAMQEQTAATREISDHANRMVNAVKAILAATTKTAA